MGPSIKDTLTSLGPKCTLSYIASTFQTAVNDWSQIVLYSEIPLVTMYSSVPILYLFVVQLAEVVEL